MLYNDIFIDILADIDETASCEYMQKVPYLLLSDKNVFHHFSTKSFFPTQDATFVCISLIYCRKIFTGTCDITLKMNPICT